MNSVIPGCRLHVGNGYGVTGQQHGPHDHIAAAWRSDRLFYPKGQGATLASQPRTRP